MESSDYRRRAAVLAVAVTVLAFLAPGAAAPVAVYAATSAAGASSTPFPADWNTYRYKDGSIIADDNGDQTPTSLDLASGSAGTEPSVEYASDGTNVFFRIRLAEDISDASKGGLVGGAFLTQIAVDDVVVAVVGVDGKSSSADYVYVSDSVGGVVTPVYTFPFDTSAGENSEGMRVLPVGDGTGQAYLDFQVPVSFIESVSSGQVTTSTPIKLYYGSSAAANLSTINKDFMAGAVTSVDFSNLATVSFLPAALSLSSTLTHVSGPNPPEDGRPSTYTVTVTATNSGGGDLTSTYVTIPFPAGTVVSDQSSSGGTLSGTGTVSWDLGTLYSGAEATATFTISATPATADIGSTITLVDGQSGGGTDVPNGTTPTATAAALTAGPVVAYVNDPPVANDSTATVAEDGSIDIVAAATDSDGDTLTLTVTTAAANGTASIVDGKIRYAPNANYYGADSITYEACDPAGACDSATVTVTVTPVNDAPVASAATETLAEDESTVIDLNALTSDVEGEAMTVSIDTAPAHGTLTPDLGNPGLYSYEPDANYNGSDSFVYQVCDSSGACTTATVSIAITPMNDAPVALADTVTIAEDSGAGSIDVAALVSEVDGDPLVFTITTPPAHGTLVADDTIVGAYTYTPAADYNGSDGFVYRACDSAGLCDNATVTITVSAVNDAPTTASTTATVDEDGSVATDVGAISGDVDGGTLSYTITTAPLNGTVIQTSPGVFTYTPDADYNGSDSYTFQVCDASSACTTGTVAVTVDAVNDAPTAPSATATVDEDSSVVIDLAALGSDPDGDTLTLTITGGPANGTLVENMPGQFTYSPNADYHGADSFEYEFCDPFGACDTGTVAVTVAAVNDAPVSSSAAETVNQNQTVTIELSTLIDDVDGDTTTISITSPPKHGTLTEPSPGVFVYTSYDMYSGPDSFEYTVCDSDGACATSEVQLAVLALPPSVLAATGTDPANLIALLMSLLIAGTALMAVRRRVQL